MAHTRMTLIQLQKFFRNTETPQVGEMTGKWRRR